MTQLREWFGSLAPRERVMVAAGAAAVIFALFYYALWRPLDHSLADARARVAAESRQARWMLGIQNEAGELEQQNRKTAPKGSDRSLLSIVDSTSRDNGLGAAVRRIQPANDNKAIVSLDHANFNKMLFWLQSLQNDYGVITRQMTVNHDDKAGTVQARLTLVRSGS